MQVFYVFFGHFRGRIFCLDRASVFLFVPPALLCLRFDTLPLLHSRQRINMNYGTREEFYGSSSPVAALRSRFEQPTPFNSPVKAVNVDTFKPVRSDTPRLNRFQSLNPSQASLGVFADRPALTAPLASRRPAAMLRRFLSEETVKKTGSAGDGRFASLDLEGYS